MDFQEVQRRYLELRADFEAGRITEEEFQEEIEGLQVKDEQGVYWTIGAQSGKWYRYDGQAWTQETPISMTKHQGRGIPERVARHLGGPAYEEGQGIPRWLQVGCFGIVLLGVVAALIFFFMMVSGQPRTTRTATPPRSVAISSPTPTIGISDTPTLSELDESSASPTLPVATRPSPVPSPTATPLTFQAYSNDGLGVKLDRPGGWQVRESVDQVVLAPDVAGLVASLVPTRALVSSATFVIARRPGGAALNADTLLDDLLAELPIEGPTTVRGTRPVYNVDWSISRVQLKAADPNKQIIAYAATALLDGTAYLVWAAAPRSEWARLEGIYQKMINSLRVTPPLLALASPSRPTAATGTTPTVPPTGLPTDTPGPAGTPTPVVYVIERGDTLGSIAMKYDVSVEDLQAINNISDPTKLQIGQQLIIPAPGYVPPTAVADQPTTTTEPVPQTRPTTSAETATRETTEVLPGEPTAETAKPTPTQTPRPQPTATPAALTGKIVYPVYDPSRMLENQPGSYDIWMSDPHGNNKQVLVFNASQPHLNPGGDLLAYRSWEPQKRGIAFLTIGGGRADLLTSYVEDTSPCWDPSSLTIVFPSRREPDRVARLYRVDQTNKNETGLGLIAEYVSTFRDGRLVFKGCSPEGACGIYVSGAEGTGPTLISSNGGDTAPAPSPDGGRIAFMSVGRDGASNYEIFVMDSGGGSVVRLTNNGAADGLPTWSPDGSTIAWVSNQGGVWAIWAMNADGSNQRQLFDMGGSPDGIVESQHDISRGWLEERISWGP